MEGNLGLSLLQILLIYTKTTRWNRKKESCVLIFSSKTRDENYKFFEQPWRHFTSLKLCQCFQPLPRVTSTSNAIKRTIIGLIMYKHSTRTRLHYLTSPQWLRGSSCTLGERQGNLALTSLCYSLDLPPEAKRWNLRSAQRSCFIQLHQEHSEKLIPSNTS